jgi:hypothetical protein
MTACTNECCSLSRGKGYSKVSDNTDHLFIVMKMFVWLTNSQELFDSRSVPQAILWNVNYDAELSSCFCYGTNR